MNGLLDTYVRSINLLQPAAAMYRAKYDCLVRLYNELTKEVPWKLEDALEDAGEKLFHTIYSDSSTFMTE